MHNLAIARLMGAAVSSHVRAKNSVFQMLPG